MLVYTPIRRVKRVVAQYAPGKPLPGGPYVITRDLPIVAAALALSVTLFGAILGLFTSFYGLLGALVAAIVPLYAAMWAIGKLQRAKQNSLRELVRRHLDAWLARPTRIEGANPFYPGVEREASNVLPVKRVLFETVDGEKIQSNIRETSDGYWAEYRVDDPLEWGLGSVDQKNGVRVSFVELFRPLLQRGAHLSHIRRPINPNDLKGDFYTDDDPDPDDIPLYKEAVERYYENVTARAQQNPTRWPSTIEHGVSFFVGRDPLRAPALRDELIRSIPDFMWNLRPISSADMYWSWYAHCTSGARLVPMGLEEVPPALPVVELDEGASGGARGKRRKLAPVLRVEVDGAVSYQSILQVEIPEEGLAFPDGTDFLSLLDHFGESVNWTIRCSPRSHEDVVRDNIQADNVISSNLEETAHHNYRLNPYAKEERLLQAYSDRMTDEAENAVIYNLLISAGTPTIEDTERLVNAIRTTLRSSYGIKITDPVPGRQEELWATMQPGSPQAALLRERGDETTVSEFAELVPFTASRAGHKTGPSIGENQTSGLRDPIRLDPEQFLYANRAATIIIIASVGGGKSTLGKIIVYYAHLRGKWWLAFDRSTIKRVGEWGALAQALPDTQIVDPINPNFSIDPFKVWADDPEQAAFAATSVLLQLEDLTDDQRLCLAEALNPKDLGGVESMMTLGRELANRRDPDAQKVGRKILVWQNYSFARSLFDETLKPIRLDAQGTVIRTNGLPLPSAEKVFSPHLHAKLTPAERFSPVLYQLTTDAASKRSADLERPLYLPTDEAWAVTRSAFGENLSKGQMRDGRKHRLIPIFMSHNAHEDFPGALFQLAPTVFVGRAENDDLAAANLAWPKAMPVTEGNIAALRRFKNGRFFMTTVVDPNDEESIQQAVEIQVELPADEAIRAALDTTPPRGRGRAGRRAA